MTPPSLAVGGAALLQAVLFATVLGATLTPYPAWDMFSWIATWLSAIHDGTWLGYLWAPHNEHRMPVIRALVALDVAACGGRGLLLVAAATAALLVTAAVAWRVARPAGVTAAWLASMLVLTVEAAVDASAPINAVFPLAVAALVGTVSLFGWRGARPWHRVAALALAPLSSLCSAWGLAVVPALAWLACHRPGTRLWAAGGAVAALAYMKLYLGYQGGAWPPWAERLAHVRPITVGRFLLNFAGLPLSRAHGAEPVGEMLGAAVLAAGLAVLCLPTRQRLPQALIIAGLSGALLVAIGRTGLEAPDRLPVRYTVLLLPLHLGLLLTALPCLKPRGVTALALALLGLQLAAAVPAVRIAAARRDVLARFYRGEPAVGMERLVYPDLAAAAAVLRSIQK